VAVVQLLAIFMFAFAVSTDGFMVGIAYGVKKIRMPIVAMTIIFLASSLAVSIAMTLGKGLASFFNPILAIHLGAIVLIIIGIYYLLQAGLQRACNSNTNEEDALLSLSLRPLGIIVQILKEPARADFDASGEISPREAFFLGMALAMDAFGAGIGLAMTGFNILLTAIIVGMLQFILINIGLIVGQIMGNERLKNVSSLLAGIILLVLGTCKLI
jgi:putative sporulation protein YtaF